MERTESIVVSVPPDDENTTIRQMSFFGWNLQGRQEVVGHLRQAEIPNNLFVAMGRGAWEEATGRKTYEYDHYVKLHFIRSLELPNLQRVKELQSEFVTLRWPQPPSLVWPVILTLVPIPGGLMMLADPLGKQGSPGLVGLVLVVIPWILLGVRWIKRRSRRAREARETCSASSKRADEILREAASLTGVPSTP